MAFIDAMRAEGHAVESTCRVLREQGCRVAARTYRAWKRGRPPAERTISDAVLTDAILATAGTPEGLYGRRKMTHHLRRAGHQVAFCTVDRLMTALGRNGIRRGTGIRTTIPAKDADRAADLVNRQFRAPAPNRIWVADFTEWEGRAGARHVRRWLAGFTEI
jgi:putative transposase